MGSYHPSHAPRFNSAGERGSGGEENCQKRYWYLFPQNWVITVDGVVWISEKNIKKSAL